MARIGSPRSRRLGALVMAALLSFVTSASGRKDYPKMNEQIALYGWVRGGASVTLARIEHVTTRAAAPAQEMVVLDVRIDQVLFGHKGEPLHHYELLRPTSEVARLKFPDPVWGRVTIRPGAEILLVVPGAPSSPDPEYVEDMASDDPVLPTVRAVLDAERQAQGRPERFARYVRWVTGGTPVERLFGAEALAKEPLGEADSKGGVANAFAAAFTSEGSLYVRLSIGSWMWDHVLSKSSAAGKAAVVNATITGLTDPSEDIRRFSLDQLVAADDALLKQPGIAPRPDLIPMLEQRVSKESDAHTKAALQRLIKALREAHHDDPHARHK